MPATDRRHRRLFPPFPSTGDSENTQITASSAARAPSSSWINANAGNIYYRPRNHVDRHHRSTASRAAQLPTPLIGPRRTRPHSIHILTYPSGYVPRELRPKVAQSPRRRAPADAHSANRHRSSKLKANGGSPERRRKHESARDTSPIRPVLHKILSTFSNRETPQVLSTPRASRPSTSSIANNSIPESSSSSPIAFPTPATDAASSPVLNHSSTAAGVPLTRSATTPGPATPADTCSGGEVARVTTGAAQHHIPGSRPADDVVGLALSPAANSAYHLYEHNHPVAVAHQHQHHHLQQAGPCPPYIPRPGLPHSLSTTDISSSPNTSTSHSLDMAGRIAAPPSAYHLPSTARGGSLMSVRSAKSAVSSFVTEVPKPVASGSGVTCSILLAEPNVFLSGFDHDGNTQREGTSGTALLRGRLQLNVTKNIKVKTVQLKLIGRARTEWPEGIPPLKTDLFEEQGLRTQVLTFFNAVNEGWESEYGNQCTYKLRNSSANSSLTNLPAGPPHRPSPSATSSPVNSSRNATTAKDLKRLSLQNNQSRSFQKGESSIASATQVKGYKVFYPGTYDYNFELPIDHHQLETTKLQYGSVRWELHATVERAGAFKPNLHGVKEVSIVRVPDQMSLEMTEPISISRQWEDQLHYDIIISGKSFPIGSKIPVAFKLTPLAKVQVHKLKVFLTESIEYWTNDKRVTRKDPGRKILLLEKSAGKPLDPMWASSEMRTVRGGELSNEERREARNTAARRRSMEASRNHTSADPLPAPTDNILGDLDLGLESLWGSTEIEANVQMPTCEMMAKNKDLRLHPDCSWKNVNVYHWIKIVMRISRLDPEDPTGTKRRHFEISIDSPFTVLNCRATQANTVLPAYSGAQSGPSPYQAVCGCPDAHSVPTDTSPNSSSGTLPNLDVGNEMPAPPQAAHLSQHNPMNPASGTQTPPNASTDRLGVDNGARPIHLLRAPSYNPPAFEEDTAPPPMPGWVRANPEAANAPLATPPPQYDVVVGTPSVDGLADYFTRLADYRFEGEDSGSDSDESPTRILGRSGRVNVAHPHTPGGRMPSRSMEIARPPIQLDMSNLANHTRPAAA